MARLVAVDGARRDGAGGRGCCSCIILHVGMAGWGSCLSEFARSGPRVPTYLTWPYTGTGNLEAMSSSMSVDGYMCVSDRMESLVTRIWSHP